MVSTETDKDITNHVYLICRKLGIKYEFPLQNETRHEVEYIRRCIQYSISWKVYLIGSLTPKINIHLMAYKKKQTV